MHILANYNGTVLDNNTYSGSVISHVGQLFFDQDLITEMAAADVYNTNTQTVTENADDTILSEAAADDFDPFVEYVYLGDSVEDGLFAWISVGVDMMQAETGIAAAATYTANGGVASTTTMGGSGMGSGSPPNGSGNYGSGMGSGDFPSGSAGSFDFGSAEDLTSAADDSTTATSTVTTSTSCNRKRV